MNPTNTAKEWLEEMKRLAEYETVDGNVYNPDVIAKFELSKLGMKFYRDCCIMRKTLERYAGEDEIEAYSEEGRWAAKTLSQVSTYPSPNEPH